MTWNNGDIHLYIGDTELKSAAECPFEELIIDNTTTSNINNQTQEFSEPVISFEQPIPEANSDIKGKINSRKNLSEKNKLDDNERHKSQKEELEDLKQAIELLDESILNVTNGKEIYIRRIYGELRQLVCRGDGYNPLLLRVAALYDLPLLVFSFPEEKAILGNVLVKFIFEYSGYSLSIKKTYSGQELMDFETWLNFKWPFKELKDFPKSKQRKNREIIGDMANNYGGAHYSASAFLLVDKLDDIKVADTKIVVKFFLEVATVVVELGKFCINKINNLSPD